MKRYIYIYISLTCNIAFSDDMPKYDVPERILNDLASDLETTFAAFRSSDANESVVREFVSPFLKRAVVSVQAEEAHLLLHVETKLAGSRGYGPVDYSVTKDDIVVLVTEAKNNDMIKGAAQNIAQMHSAVEVLSGSKPILDNSLK
jgi:hypothetical protein